LLLISGKTIFIVISNKNRRLFLLKLSYSNKYLSQLVANKLAASAKVEEGKKTQNMEK